MRTVSIRFLLRWASNARMDSTFPGGPLTLANQKRIDGLCVKESVTVGVPGPEKL